MNIPQIEKYFPLLTDRQIDQLGLLPELYREWNSMINVISRKDIDNIVTNHILHSMSISKFIHFREGTKVFDIGTGGGFPGIPLAILYPEVSFLLIDSIGKKVKVATSVAQALGLSNVECLQTRAEMLDQKCHFIVSRGAMKLGELVSLGQKCIDKTTHLNALPNGVIALKGGDLTSEIHPYRHISTLEDLERYFDEPFFETKKIIYVPL